MESHQRTIRETTLIEAINTVELTKRSLQQALLYSFYQSSYDVGKVGGSEKKYSGNEISYWRVYSDVHYSREKFIKDLQTNTHKIFNEYASALNNPVIIPSYERVEINDDDVKKSKNEIVVISANATPKTSLQLKGKFYDIQDNPTVTERFNMKTFKMFDTADENFLKKDRIKEDSVINGILASGLSGLSRSGDTIKNSGSLSWCEACPSSEAVFSATNGMSSAEAKEKIKQTIDKKLTELETGMSDSKIPLKFQNRQIGSDIDLDCTSSGIPDCCIPCIDGGCCGVSYCTTTCTFTYYGAAKTLVKTTDMSNKYPVYDEKDKMNDMRNIQLQFYDISGTKRLIEP